MVEIGDIKKVGDDLKELFFLTSNKMISKQECVSLVNQILMKVGCNRGLTVEEFDRLYTKEGQAIAQAQKKPIEIPASEVQHDGQYHQVPVNVQEGQQQFVNVDEGMKK